MLRFFLSTILLGLFLGGCSYKVDTANINADLISDTSNTQRYSTYSPRESKITQYFFKQKNTALEATDVITYLPIYPEDELYSPFSNITHSLRYITIDRAKTLEEALLNDPLFLKQIRLFKNTDEYLISNDLAHELSWAIREFEDKMQRRDDRDERRIITP